MCFCDSHEDEMMMCFCDSHEDEKMCFCDSQEDEKNDTLSAFTAFTVIVLHLTYSTSWSNASILVP